MMAVREGLAAGLLNFPIIFAAKRERTGGNFDYRNRVLTLSLEAFPGFVDQRYLNIPDA